MDMPIIAVVGATGNQGGGLVKAILEDGQFQARAITRNADSDKAKALSSKGVQVVKADLDDLKSLEAAFADCWGVFIMSNYWELFDVEKEVQHVENQIQAAKTAGVQHVIYSSLEDTRDVLTKYSEVPRLGNYSVPHFDGKGKLNQKVLDELPATVLLTTFFYENWTGFSAPKKNHKGEWQIMMNMAEAPLTMIAVEDIGRAALEIFKHHEEFVGKTVGIAGDSLPVSEIAQIMTEVLNRPVTYVPIPLESFRGLGFPGADDVANMYAYYVLDAEGFANRRKYDGIRFQSFRDWLEAHKDEVIQGM
jgi:uncharacterized protein YbjT (DUF2867 family)